MFDILQWIIYDILLLIVIISFFGWQFLGLMTLLFPNGLGKLLDKVTGSGKRGHGYDR